jgi:Spy/CpxP family protein refolding chaperone
MRLLGWAALAAGVLMLTTGGVNAQQGKRPGGPGGMMGSMRAGGMMLLLNKGVQEELKLTEEQTKKLKEAGEKAMEAFGGLRDKNEEERKEAMKKMGDDSKKMLTELLKPEQYNRFKQIERQQAGIAMFADEEVQEKVKLTDEQKEKIKGIADEARKDGEDLRKTANAGNFAEIMKKGQALRKEATEKALATLTDAQKKTVKELLGEPFELKMEGFGGLGGNRPRPKKDDN